jgi:hypothetical protein
MYPSIDQAMKFCLSIYSSLPSSWLQLSIFSSLLVEEKSNKCSDILMMPDCYLFTCFDIHVLFCLLQFFREQKSGR